MILENWKFGQMLKNDELNLLKLNNNIIKYGNMELMKQIFYSLYHHVSHLSNLFLSYLSDTKLQKIHQIFICSR